ncbi:MAG: DnaJ domain-containing protein [Vicinamibacteria bacterium]
MADHPNPGEGDFAESARLFRTLRGAYARGVTGRLHLVRGRELRQVRFEAGAIADASSDVAGERFGDVLLARGAVSAPELHRAMDAALRDRRRLGSLLLEMGLVPREDLREAIGDHVRRVVRTALGAPGLALALEETSPRPDDRALECPVSIGQLFVDLSREMDARRGLAALALDGRALTLAADRRLRLQALVLSPADGFVLSRLDGTLSVSDLESVVPLPREEVERSLFGLICAGVVEPAEVTARPRPARPRTAPPFVPVPPLTPAAGVPALGPRPGPSDLRRRILEAHRGQGGTHYDVLGVSPQASDSEIRAAYARLMRTFHPDAARGPELHDVEVQRHEVCLRLGQAFEELKSPRLRAAYDDRLKLWRRSSSARSAAPPAPASRPSARVAGPAAERTAPSTVAGLPVAEPPVAEPAPAAPAAGAPAPPSILGEEESRAAVESARQLVEGGAIWDAILHLEPLLPRLAPASRAAARVALARAYARNPNWQHKAEETLRLAIEDSPRDLEPRLALAGLYLDLGLPARAGAVYRAILEIDPRNAAARQALGAPAPGPTPPAPAGSGSVLKRLLGRS